jgi:glutaredoxin 3
MSRIILYTTPYCGFCHAAKRLLAGKGQSFLEIDVSGDPEKRTEMISLAFGRRTVPQIFIDGRHIGGYQELAELDRAGKLDPLLAAGAASGAEAP